MQSVSTFYLKKACDKKVKAAMEWPFLWWLLIRLSIFFFTVLLCNIIPNLLPRGLFSARTLFLCLGKGSSSLERGSQRESGAQHLLPKKAFSCPRVPLP